jgi:excisionase family DNA binding protein
VEDDVLVKIMGTEEAAEKWGLHQDSIKRLCASKRVKAVRIGKTWVLVRDQPNPKTRRD